MQWFRRAIHAMASSFIIFYILEDSAFWFILKRTIAIAIMLILLMWGLKRKMEKDRIHGLLREHETENMPSFLWFGLGAAILFLMPYSLELNGTTINLAIIGASCIFSAALVDPVISVVRKKKGKAWGFLIGFLLASLIFYLFGLEQFSLLGGLALAGFESFPMKLDDDFTTQIGTAAVFLVIGFLGYLPPVGLPFEQISLPELMGLAPVFLLALSLRQLSYEEKFIMGITLIAPFIAAAFLVINGGWELAALMLVIQIYFDAMAIKEIRGARV